MSLRSRNWKNSLWCIQIKPWSSAAPVGGWKWWNSSVWNQCWFLWKSDTLPPIIMEVGNDPICKGNKSWGNPLPTSMIMGGRVPTCNTTLYGTYLNADWFTKTYADMVPDVCVLTVEVCNPWFFKPYCWQEVFLHQYSWCMKQKVADSSCRTWLAGILPSTVSCTQGFDEIIDAKLGEQPNQTGCLFMLTIINGETHLELLHVKDVKGGCHNVMLFFEFQPFSMWSKPPLSFTGVFDIKSKICPIFWSGVVFLTSSFAIWGVYFCVNVLIHIWSWENGTRLAWDVVMSRWEEGRWMGRWGDEGRGMEKFLKESHIIYSNMIVNIWIYIYLYLYVYI